MWDLSLKILFQQLCRLDIGANKEPSNMAVKGMSWVAPLPHASQNQDLRLIWNLKRPLLLIALSSFSPNMQGLYDCHSSILRLLYES